MWDFLNSKMFAAEQDELIIELLPLRGVLTGPGGNLMDVENALVIHLGGGYMTVDICRSSHILPYVCCFSAVK